MGKFPMRPGRLPVATVVLSWDHVWHSTTYTPPVGPAIPCPGIDFSSRLRRPTGSDYIPFEQSGIPVIFPFSGFHDDYHGVNDEADRLDYDRLGYPSPTCTRWSRCSSLTCVCWVRRILNASNLCANSEVMDS